jgi:hypothetical protein
VGHTVENAVNVEFRHHASLLGASGPVPLGPARAPGPRPGR